MFRVHILGSNSAAPAHNRHHTAQLVVVDNHHFLIDCGEGTQDRLKKYGLKVGRIDHIFISHLHGDHYLGLMGLISSQHLQNRSKPLYIYGQKGLEEIITIQLKYSQTFLKFPIIFKELRPDVPETLLSNNKLSVRAFPLKHRVPCCGFVIKEKPKPRRVIKEVTQGKLGLEHIATLKKGQDVFDEEGQLLYSIDEYTKPPKKSVAYAYCSDTKYDEDIIPHINKADLLYHEATFTEEFKTRAAETFHSTAAEAATIAKKASVEKLLLGHFSIRYKLLDPLLAEAKELFENVELAIEGETFIIQE